MLDAGIDLNDLYLFFEVAERKGFTAAGDALGLPKSSLSRRIAKLEARLGVRLLQRSPRGLHLTDAGHVLHAHCVGMLGSAQAGIDAVQQRSDAPMGKVRMSIPVALAGWMADSVLPRFLHAFPDIQLSVQATNRNIDLISEGIDVVVRGLGLEAALDSSSLVQAHLCTVPWKLVCSPGYLRRHGAVQGIEDLARADLLLYSTQSDPEPVLRLSNGLGEMRSQHVRIRMASDNLDVLHSAALADLGLCGLPGYLCNEDLAQGRLVRLIEDWRPSSGALVLLFPSRRGLLPAVRAVIDFLKEELPLLAAAG